MEQVPHKTVLCCSARNLLHDDEQRDVVDRFQNTSNKLCPLSLLYCLVAFLPEKKREKPGSGTAGVGTEA